MPSKPATDSPFVFKLKLNGRLTNYSVTMRELPLREVARLAEMDSASPRSMVEMADLLDTYCVAHDLPVERLSDVGAMTAQKIYTAWLAGSEDAAVPPADAGDSPAS